MGQNLTDVCELEQGGVGTEPNFLVANQLGGGGFCIIGTARSRNQKEDEAQEVPPGPGPSPVLPQRVSCRPSEEGVNSCISKMRTLKSERLSKLSQITQLACSKVGI